MRQVEAIRVSTAGVSSASMQEKAARHSMLVLDRTKIPSMHAAKWRRRRDRHAEPSPFARTLLAQHEYAEMGVPRERAQMDIDELQREHDAAYGPLDARLTPDDFGRELAAESEENALTLRLAMKDESVNTLRAWVDAAKREVSIQNVMIRKAEAMLAATERA